MLKSHFTSNRNYSQHSRVTTIKVLSRSTILNIVEYTVEICTPPLFFRQTYPSSTVCARLIFRVPFRGEERFLACTSYLTSKDSFSFIVDKPLSMGSQQPVSYFRSLLRWGWLRRRWAASMIVTSGLGVFAGGGLPYDCYLRLGRLRRRCAVRLLPPVWAGFAGGRLPVRLLPPVWSASP